jgi:ABC-type lipoprotein release transport system permease subunit
VIGMAAGLLGAAGLGRVMRGMLYEVPWHDPVAFGAASSVLLVVALLAAWLPARHTARVQPLSVLRGE